MKYSLMYWLTCCLFGGKMPQAVCGHCLTNAAAFLCEKCESSVEVSAAKEVRPLKAMGYSR